jgi:hypothetical protein
MNSSHAGSLGLLVVAAFLAGLGAGWLLATVRGKGSGRTSLLPTDTATGTRRPVTRRIQTMELKCACGSLLKFRDPVEPGYQPYPSGDSVTCPNCGRTRDLKEIRKLESESRARPQQ